MTSPTSVDGRLVVPEGLEQQPDPNPTLSAIRAAGQAVRGRVGHGVEAWLICHHKDIRDLHMNAAVSPDPTVAAKQLDKALRFDQVRRLRKLGAEMTTSDPPVHTRLRTFARRAMDRDLIADAASEGIEIAKEAAVRFKGAPTFDIVHDYAEPVAIGMMCALLGIRGELGGTVHWLTEKILQWPDSSAAAVEIETARTELRTLIMELLDEKRTGPPQHDLLSRMTIDNATTGELSRSEMVSMAELYLMAGHDTTSAAIGNGVRALQAQPHAWKGVVEHRFTDAAVIDELLRLDGPVFFQFRCTRSPVQVGTQKIPEGEVLCFLLHAAHRDPGVFEHPHAIDFARRERSLSFGWGIHNCMGVPLASAVVRKALRALAIDGDILHRNIDEATIIRRRRVRALKSCPMRLMPGY